MNTIQIVLVLFANIFHVIQTDRCPNDKLIVYKVILHTFWSRDKFPKHYPDWKPVAQWSKLIGRSHDSTYELYRIGKNASLGLKNFVENNQMDDLEDDRSTSQHGIFDRFVAGAIAAGTGRTETEFFVDAQHSKVSIVSRMIPSPDWFIGIDSFDLCANGNWLDSITFQLDPLDAGTDNGFTFMAQNWITEPQGVIYRIRARYPSHPAGSFFYPNRQKLPTIATAQFIKLKEYNLIQQFNYAQDNKHYDVMTPDNNDESDDVGMASDNLLMQQNTYYDNNDMTKVRQGDNGDLQLAIEEEREESERSLAAAKRPWVRKSSGRERNLSVLRDSVPTGFRDGDSKNQLNIPTTTTTTTTTSTTEPETIKKPALFNRKRSNKKSRIAKDCKVSEWSDWSPCSTECGIGETIRRRRIVRKERRGGKLCPPLKETKWCGGGYGSSTFWLTNCSTSV